MYPSTSGMTPRNREDTNMDNEELENLKDFMRETFLTLDDIQIDLEDGGIKKVGRIVADASAHLEKAIDLMDREILKRTTKVTRSR
jgi:hypothetical protein